MSQGKPMVVCGIDIDGCTARVVVLSGTSDNYLVVGTPSKISLSDPDSQAEVRSFGKTVEALLRDHAVELVAIRARAKTGKFAGGANSFKIEAAIQLSAACSVRLVAPQSIAAFVKKTPSTLPDMLHKYQQEAFDVARLHLP